MKKRKLFRLIGCVLGCLVLLSAFVYFVSWKSPQYYNAEPGFSSAMDSIIPFIDYGRLSDHERPYIIRSDTYVIFGAEHTRDPGFFEIDLIEKEWKRLKPTVALVEGRLGFLIPGLMNPVKFLGEGGKVKALAQSAGVPVYNWDLSKEALAEKLQTKFNAEQIALAQILNPYFGQVHFGKPASPEDYIKPYLKRAANVGEETTFKTVEDVDRVWKKYFAEGEDWRVISDYNGLPGYLDSMAVFTNDLRNRQLVNVVKELLSNNEVVFVICGSSHAVCISTAFKPGL